MIDNHEFRELISDIYDSRQVRFCRETGFTPQAVCAWVNDRKRAPLIVLLYLRQRRELIGLLCDRSS